MFCPSIHQHQSKPCFLSSSSLVTKYLIIPQCSLLHHSYSLWPEKDDINPKVNVPGRGAEKHKTHLRGILCIYSCKTQSASLSHLSLVHLSFCCFTFFYSRHTFLLKSCPAMVYTSVLWKQAVSC